jgi:hypothetical protein
LGRYPDDAKVHEDGWEIVTGDDDRGLKLTDHIEDRSAASLKHPPAAGDVIVGEEPAAGTVGRPEGSHRFPGWAWAWAVAVGVAGVAFATRLVPVLRGGGLYGLGNYDDGVYYSAASFRTVISCSSSHPESPCCWPRSRWSDS